MFFKSENILLLIYFLGYDSRPFSCKKGVTFLNLFDNLESMSIFKKYIFLWTIFFLLNSQIKWSKR